jgi:hypothetical protein
MGSAVDTLPYPYIVAWIAMRKAGLAKDAVLIQD